jgi:hypothetical protein
MNFIYLKASHSLSFAFLATVYFLATVIEIFTTGPGFNKLTFFIMIQNCTHNDTFIEMVVILPVNCFPLPCNAWPPVPKETILLLVTLTSVLQIMLAPIRTRQ